MQRTGMQHFANDWWADVISGLGLLRGKHGMPCMAVVRTTSSTAVLLLAALQAALVL